MKSGLHEPASNRTSYFEFRVYLSIFSWAITSKVFRESLSHVSFFWLIYRLNGIGDVRIVILGIMSWLLHCYGYFCGLFFDIVENGILSLSHKTSFYVNLG